MDGADIRLGALFQAGSGRGIITAFDHGTTLRVSAPARRTLQAIVDGGPDGVLLSPGMLAAGADLFARRGAPVPVLRADWTVIDEGFKSQVGEHHRVNITPHEALSLGAGAICMYLISGPADGRQFADNVRSVARAAVKARKAGIPLIVEATLWGSQHSDKHDPDTLQHMCRVAFEIGAHAIKTEYTGDPDSMRQIVESVECPVLTLGGAKGERRKVLADARAALGAGVKGLIFGRNVWDTDDPAATTRELLDLVHATPTEGDTP